MLLLLLLILLLQNSNCVQTKATIVLHFVTAITVQDGGHQ